jgi:hypothetical protein
MLHARRCPEEWFAPRGAYVMPSPAFGAARKHLNHLRLLEHMFEDNVARRLAGCSSMRDAFDALRATRGWP